MEIKSDDKRDATGTQGNVPEQYFLPIIRGVPMTTDKSTFDVFLAVQSLIAVILVIVLCVMLLAGMVIPDLLVGLTGIVVGQYFGARQGASAVRQQAIGVQAMAEALGS